MLRGEGYIHLNFNPPRWSWDFDKIVNLDLSDNVVGLLVKEMQRLDADLQLALKVASCLPSCVDYFIFDILSKDLNIDLRSLLSQVVKKGFMINVGDDKIRFAHDKIQQAAYELLTEEERMKNHMRFGLAICSQVLNAGVGEHDDMFFLAVNQINRGGPGMLTNPNQRVMIAGLNKKAGERSIELSDLSTAQKLFEQGEKTWFDSYPDDCLIRA